MKLIAPFYKGLVHVDSQESIALITRHDPVTGREIAAEHYVDLVREASKTATELTQDIARAGAAALLANREKQRGTDARLITVEGCPQVVGGKAVTGAEIMESIWKWVMPEALMNSLPDPIVEHISDCTVREARVILSHVNDGGTVQGITHDYHQLRVQRVLREEMNEKQLVPPVLTPEQVIEQATTREPSFRFIADLVHAGSPSAETKNAERKKEVLVYKPLHMLSRLGRKFTLGQFDLELFLAKKMRK